MYGIIGYEMLKEVVKLTTPTESGEQNAQKTASPVVRLLGKLWLPTVTHFAEASDKSNINCSRLDTATQK
jgi:hypothetical protein